MKRTFSILFFVFFCQILVFAQPELKAKLDKLLEEDFLKTSEVGISVYDLTDGKSLYTYQENKLYRPASIQKLITAITGLSVLGPDHFGLGFIVSLAALRQSPTDKPEASNQQGAPERVVTQTWLRHRGQFVRRNPGHDFPAAHPLCR